MNKEKYNQIIEEAYVNYKKYIDTQRNIQRKEVQRLRSEGKRVKVTLIELLSKEEFINKCKTDSEFSEKWGLNILETYDLVPHTEDFGDVTITRPIRKNKLIIVYKNEIIEIYE